MFNLLEVMDAAQEHHQRLLTEAEEHRRFQSCRAIPARYTAAIRRVLNPFGNLLIALGTRLKSAPPPTPYDEAANEVIGRSHMAR